MGNHSPNPEARRNNSLITTATRETKPSLTPKQYADAVSNHALQTTETSPFPGSNFENLGQYLQQAFVARGHRASELRKPVIVEEDYPFVTTYNYDGVGSWGPSREDTNPDPDPDPESPQVLPLNPDKPAILFLRGKPSAKWLSSLGAAWKIDPEFFNRHLDFRSTQGRIDYFPLPSLPSAQTLLFHLPCITLGQVKNPPRQTMQSTINAMRAQCVQKMDQYWRTMHKWFDQDRGVGESIVRNFRLHDQTHFAIEQRISIVLNKSGGSWQLIVWLDAGKSLSGSPAGAPWLVLDDPKQPKGLRNTFAYPTIRTRNSLALRSHSHRVEGQSDHHDDLAQSIRMLHADYGRQLDSATMASDPFYALHDVLEFIAVSYRQYLNMLEDKNRQRSTSALASIETLSDPSSISNRVSTGWTLANLHYDQAVLETHVAQLNAALELISHRLELGDMGHSKQTWPRARDTTQAARARDAAVSLHRDYTGLVAQAERLLRLYKDGMALLMNQAVMAETAKSFAQAKEVTRLSRLAFVFIPLSFTATFMGMNVREFDEWGTQQQPQYQAYPNSQIPIWLWVAVSVPVLVISFALMMWDSENISAAIVVVRGWLGWGKGRNDQQEKDSPTQGDTV